tara:strand:+ start:126 stop:752 length:627 start_codon:yes stop_codon:yes gene_type:complete
MADEKGNWAWNPLIGELNPHTRDDPYFLDHDTGDNLYQTKRRLDYISEKAHKHTHDGEWYGICLDSTVEYYEEGQTLGFSLSSDLENPVGMIAVIARIPALDSVKCMPKSFGSIEKLDEFDKFWLISHATKDRVFRCPIGKHQQPSPGDLVIVDWEDRKSFTGPIYCGIKEPGIGFMPDRPISETGEAGEAQTAFDNAGSDITQNGDY